MSKLPSSPTRASTFELSHVAFLACLIHDHRLASLPALLGHHVVLPVPFPTSSSALLLHEELQSTRRGLPSFPDLKASGAHHHHLTALLQLPPLLPRIGTSTAHHGAP